MAVVVVMVSSTRCGVAVVDSGFIHPLLCSCGAGNGGGNMGVRLQGHVKASPPLVLWPVV